ncbi:MAG: hypothetical protein NW216_10175 [Hyphomicrobium sp.]|nr:hypothetical protein [Hyphomicrobium sp.]
MSTLVKCVAAGLVLLIVAQVFATGPVRATVQEDDLCMEPDIEFPVPCEEDE